MTKKRKSSKKRKFEEARDFERLQWIQYEKLMKEYGKNLNTNLKPY